MFGRKIIIEIAKADIVNTNIPLKTLKGLQILNNITKPVQVTAIDAIVARVAFEMSKKY